MAGHSYGANTSLLLAGVAIPGLRGLGANRASSRRRVHLRPATARRRAASSCRARRHPAAQPCTSPASDDVIRIPGFFSERQGPRAAFSNRPAVGNANGWRSSKADRTAVFTDRSGTGGAVQNPRIKAATQGSWWPSFVQAKCWAWRR